MATVDLQTVINDALTEINALQAGETAESVIYTFALGKLTRLLESWNAVRALAYATQFLDFTLVPGTNPHTIGPDAADWTTTTRPVSIEAADLVLTSSTPSIYQPLTLRDDRWWMALAVPDLATSIPTDLYYNPDWEDGAVYLWPVPTVAYDIRLLCRFPLTVGDTMDFPQGYRDAVTLTLAEELAPSMGREVPARTALSAMRARAAVMANNDQTPRIGTADAGMPTSGGTPRARHGMFNYRSGMTF